MHVCNCMTARQVHRRSRLGSQPLRRRAASLHRPPPAPPPPPPEAPLASIALPLWKARDTDALSGPGMPSKASPEPERGKGGKGVDGKTGVSRPVQGHDPQGLVMSRPFPRGQIWDRGGEGWPRYPCSVCGDLLTMWNNEYCSSARRICKICYHDGFTFCKGSRASIPKHMAGGQAYSSLLPL